MTLCLKSRTVVFVMASYRRREHKKLLTEQCLLNTEWQEIQAPCTIIKYKCCCMLKHTQQFNSWKLLSARHKMQIVDLQKQIIGQQHMVFKRSYRKATPVITFGEFIVLLAKSQTTTFVIRNIQHSEAFLKMLEN